MKTLIFLLYVAVVLFIISLCGCGIVPGFIKGTTTPAEEAASVKAHAKVLPRVYLIPDALKDGERVIGVVVANEIDKGYSAAANKKEKEVRYTLWQRILRGMMGWGIVTIVIFVLLAIFAPGVMVAILAWLKGRWKKIAMETAKGLEAAEVKDRFPVVAEKLETSQSDKTKMAIKELRAKGKI